MNDIPIYLPPSVSGGGPAFPLQGGVEQLESSLPVQGMTLRDYFAAKAMQGLLAAGRDAQYGDGDMPDAARASYALADAMLIARSA